MTTTAPANGRSVASPPGNGRWGALVRTSLPPSIVFGLSILGWYLVSYFLLSDDRAFLLPPPHEVVQDAFLDPKTRSEIFHAAWVTTEVAFLGLLAAFVIGSLTAILMSQARWIERSIYPYAVTLQTVPILAIVPLIGVWFGFGVAPRVVVCVTIAIFPLIINTLTGLLRADPGLHDLLTLHGAGRLTRLVRLQIPAALPDVFVGLRSAAGASVVGAVVGDFFFGRGDVGLGLLINKYSSRLMYGELLGAVVVACLLGIAVFVLFGALARRVTGAWAESWSHQR